MNPSFNRLCKRIDGDSCVAEEMCIVCVCVCVCEERRGEKHKIDKETI